MSNIGGSRKPEMVPDGCNKSVHYYNDVPEGINITYENGDHRLGTCNIGTVIP